MTNVEYVDTRRNELDKFIDENKDKALLYVPRSFLCEVSKMLKRLSSIERHILNATTPAYE